MDDLEYFINQFSGGISSDEYLTPDGACFDMENVDINKSSMCITASNGAYKMLNTREHGNIIAVSPTGDEWVTEDGIIESWEAHGSNRGSGVCCLFTFPMLGPKLLSSGGSQIIGHTRHNELKTAIRGNAGSYPFWLLLNNKTFSLVNPDALSGTTDKIGGPSSPALTLGTGWAYNPDAELGACLQHSGGTASVSATITAEYGNNNDYTTTNYQMFWIGVQNHKHGKFKVKVTADLDVFQWDSVDGEFDYNSTDNNQTKTWDWVEKSYEDGERFCYAINGVHTNATWEVIPSDDFDGELFWLGALNQENFLSADGDNNPDHGLSLDNSTVKDLGRAGMGIDTTDLQDRAVITEQRGNYVVGAGNYAITLNTEISKDNYQMKPSTDILLPTSYEVMGITSFGDQITFYANSNGNGYQLVWDGNTIYFDYIYTWANQTFETVISSLGYDYVTVRSARNEMQYYVVNGPQRNQIGGSMEMLSSPSGKYKRILKEQAKLLTQRDDKEIGGKLGMMWCGQPVFAGIGGDLLVYGSRKAGIGNSWYKPLSIGFDGGNSGTEGLKYAEIECVGPCAGGGIAMFYRNGNGENCIRGLYTGYWDENGVWVKQYYWNRWFSYTLNPIIGSHFTEKEIDKFFISYKLPNAYWKINLYAKVDDNMFWRIKPTSDVTISKGDVYYLEESTDTLEYIGTDGDWLVFRRTGQFSFIGGVYLYRKSGTGTSTITIKEVDNRVKVGTLSYNGFDHNYENLLNTQVMSKLPFFHKIQFKIEGECIDENTEGPWTESLPPEIYNIYIPFKQHTVG